MRLENKIINDVKKLATSSFAILTNMKDEVSKLVKDQVKAALKSCDLITRNELELIKKVQVKQSAELLLLKKELNQKGILANQPDKNKTKQGSKKVTS